MEVLPTTFTGALSLIGSTVFIGTVISLLLARSKGFNALSSGKKFWIVGGICIGLPVISHAGLSFLPASFIQAAEFWWPPIVTGLGVWTTSQAWYAIFGEKIKG